jgi:tetratricopeptide (TPR) repeat protein
LLPAQNPKEKPKQQAKDLVERAKGEDSDKLKQVHDLCDASKLEPKNKKYLEACNDAVTHLYNDDKNRLANANEAYTAHDLEKAEYWLNLVTTLDDKLSAQAHALQDKIKADRLYTQMKTAWDRGDLAGVSATAPGLANSDYKAAAAIYLDDVNKYKQYMDGAQKLETGSPEEAIKQYALAKQLNPNGPGDPAGKIQELVKRRSQIVATTPPPPITRKTGTEQERDIQRQVSKLLSSAQDAEKQNNLQDALADYESILKLQPNNKDAQGNVDRINQAIKNNPADAARNELKSGIRSFYQGQFDDAQRALRDYLSSAQTAQNPGVAYFYLGATLLEKSLLETPQSKWQGAPAEVQSSFKEARKVNYNPPRAYISPALLKVWDATTP